MSRALRAPREAAVGLAAYAAYLGVRRAVWTDEGRAAAVRNARRLARLERRLGIAVEDRAQRVMVRRPRLLRVLGAGYAAANVGVTVVWLITLFRRRDPDYGRERDAALIAFLLALPAFRFLPVAPPRHLDDHVDVLALGGLRLDHPVLVRFYDPVAAFPSQHVAFAVVTGWGLARRRRTRSARAAWRAYPAAVAALVVATANHWVLDVVAGGALGALARAVTRRSAPPRPRRDRAS